MSCVVFDTISNRKSEGNSVVLIHEKEFVILAKSPYIDVLSKHEVPRSISKSYFYYAFSKLRSLKLLKGRSLGFRLVVPMRKRGRQVEIGNGLLVNLNGRLIYYYSSSRSNCAKCDIKDICVKTLKDVSKHLKVRLATPDPYEGWSVVLDKVSKEIEGHKAIELGH